MYAKPSHNATGPLAGVMPGSFLARLPTVVPPREGPRLEEGVTRFSTNLTGIGGQRQIIEP
jgi:hypothetical protein